MVMPVLLHLLPCGVEAQSTAPLPTGVKPVWDLRQAHRQTTATRERVCVNGLWRWQPADPASERVPSGRWGHFKVPGCWPGITNYMQKDCQTVHAHPSWGDRNPRDLTAAWYQREIAIPAEWAGRRVALHAEYLNSFAAVYVDGDKAGEIQFPAGEVDLTSLCRPGGKHVLSVLVVAIPLKGVMLAFNDSNAARTVRGSVARRGFCGDVWLTAEPAKARVSDVKVDTSVRKGEISLEVALDDIVADATYALHAQIDEGGRTVKEFASKPFGVSELTNGRIALTETWKPDKLWDTHTPRNQYDVTVSLVDARGRALDTSYPVRFGFRELWIDGRDFYLNGSRIFLCALPFDNAQVGAAWATYEGAKESMERLRSWGVNAVYTHNYGCEPGTHLGFEEILRAADDVGMLISLSQPHFGQYDWKADDADETNGYARHARFYVRVAQNHPSVVMYSTSHNATGYSEDMNPDLIDGLYEGRSEGSRRNADRALRAEAIVKRLDPSRILYHHSSGNLGSMHTSNFYPNWVPIQEMSDWFEHWATDGVKPVFTCEYGAPFMWDWAMYRGWYKGSRSFGSAVVPWEFCLAEWNAQFLGDAAYRISEQEKRNLRWEAGRFRAGELWHRWDYPHALGSRDFDERYPILAAYLDDNWRAFRTWGVSAVSPWEHGVFWKQRPDLDRNQRLELETDWDDLQRPGFSPDYVQERYERMDLAYERTDWVTTLAAESMLRNNAPLLAYIAGKPDHFTSKDHNFLPGEALDKQLIVINNSRATVTAECAWSLDLPQRVTGTKQVTVATGDQKRLPLHVDLPVDLRPGTYELAATVRFSTGPTQEDSFAIHVLPPPTRSEISHPTSQIQCALFDPKGETARLLSAMGVRCRSVEANADLSGYDVLIIGKATLTADGAAPNIDRVRDGLKVLVFEQTAEALEKRLGFRVAEYGLRNVFRRVPDHPILAGLADEHLRDWRGKANLLPPRLKYEPSNAFNGVPVVRWCGLEVPRLWRCGNRGNVASVLIEKPPVGDFLPIIDGGFSLQYSPLVEYREGKGMVLFCQLDVTGRSEEEPAATQLLTNILSYVSHPSDTSGQHDTTRASQRKALYAGAPAGKRHLERTGIAAADYTGGALSADQVLIVGRGGGLPLAEHRRPVSQWLNAGGHLLALELEADEANAFLPLPVETADREHIAAYFAPPAAGSSFAGLGPADVHNRDPRAVPLVTGGADPVGNGVLAQTGNAVFCQLAPYSFLDSPRDVPGFVVTGDDAVDGRQSALLTMATVPGGQFGQKVEAGEPGKTYTFATFVKPLDQPVTVRLEIERAGRPWDRAVRGEDTELPADKWTELHVTFKVDEPFPEGWFAYIHCGQAGSRLRADLFRLYEGAHVPGGGNAQGGQLLVANPSFEEDTKPWVFSWRTEQLNLRKTYRRSSFLLTRLLANMGIRGDTPLLARFATPTTGTPREAVTRNGDFHLDADGDGMPDGWQLSASSPQASCVLEEITQGETDRCLRITCPDLAGKERGSTMLAQHGVPAEKGQWYRISLSARATGLDGASVTVALQDTATWTSCFDYQRFVPQSDWKEFTFLVQSRAAVETKTRFQIWHGSIGTLWLADVRMAPCDPPSQGRWTSGLYLDTPAAMDDPYRFFRW